MVKGYEPISSEALAARFRHHLSLEQRRAMVALPNEGLGALMESLQTLAASLHIVLRAEQWTALLALSDEALGALIRSFEPTVLCGNNDGGIERDDGRGVCKEEKDSSGAGAVKEEDRKDFKST